MPRAPVSEQGVERRFGESDMPKSPNEKVERPPTVSAGEVAKRVEAWVSSQNGTKQLLATTEAARQAAESVISDAKIEPEQLRKAITL